MGLLKILILVFLGVTVLGGGTYAVINSSARVATNGEKSTMDSNAVSTRSSATLRELMGLKERVMCTFTSFTEETGGTVAGTVYVDDGRVRGDFTVEQAGTELDSHLVIRDGEMHSWTFTPHGTFAYAMAFTPETTVDMSSDAPISVDDSVDYTCTPWGGDDSKFTFPTDLTFTRVEDVVQATVDAEAALGVGGSAQCAACAQIPDQGAQAQCLSMLQCN